MFAYDTSGECSALPSRLCLDDVVQYKDRGN